MRKLILACVLVSCAVLLGMGGQSVPMGALPVPTVAPALYYGVGCDGSTTMTCSGGDSTYPANTNRKYTRQFTTGAVATVDKCALYVATMAASNHSWRCAIYTVSGGAASLVSGCAQTSDQTYSSTGWNESAMPGGCTLAASTTYQIAWEVSDSGTSMGYSSTLPFATYYADLTYGDWPSSFDAASGNAPYSAYIKVH